KDILHRKTNIRIDELLQTLYNGFSWIVTRIAKQTGRQLQKASVRKSMNMKNCRVADQQLKDYDISRAPDGSFEVVKTTLESDVNGNHEDEPFVDVPKYSNPSSTLPRLLPSFPEPSTLYDEFVVQVDILSEKMRKLKANKENEPKMREILELIRSANSLEDSIKTPRLIARRNSAYCSQNARDTMNFKKLRVRKKAKRREYDDTSVQTVRIQKDPSICNACHNTDPELPNDMDADEFDSRITEWLRCSNQQCKQPVHYLCSNGKCPSCDSHYECYQPSGSSNSSSLSESDGEGPSTR
uniref:Uncharacterized protein n=1 Tax=Caenorhabditis japonica TaxID=281687 RepID=A0A8R1E8P6_CAEJA